MFQNMFLFFFQEVTAIVVCWKYIISVIILQSDLRLYLKF